MKIASKSQKRSSKTQAVSQARNEEDQLFKADFKAAILRWFKHTPEVSEMSVQNSMCGVIAGTFEKTRVEVYTAFKELLADGIIQSTSQGYVLKSSLQGKPPSIHGLCVSLDETDTEISKAAALLESMAANIFEEAKNHDSNHAHEIANGFLALTETTIRSLKAAAQENWEYAKALREKLKGAGEGGAR